MPRKYRYEDVQKYVSENSNCELLSKEDVSVTKKLKFRCSCGNEFETDFHHFVAQKQRQCPDCGKKKAHKSTRLTLEEINERLSVIGCSYISGDYVNRKSNIPMLCSCGHEKTMRLNTALTNNFSGLCQRCSDERFRGWNRFTISQIREACKEKGIELLSSEYRSMKDPLEFKCVCGRTFVTTWEIVSYYGKTRCDLCSSQTSSGERAIMKWLEDHGLTYEREKLFDGCGGRYRRYRFDFYLPDQNTCIEFDGQQHFKTVNFNGKTDEETLSRILWDTQCRDLVKDIYCDEHGIDLIRIRYDEADNIPEILSDKLIPR